MVQKRDESHAFSSRSSHARIKGKEVTEIVRDDMEGWIKLLE